MKILRVLLAFALMVTGVVSTVGSGGGGDGSNVDCCDFFPPPQLPAPDLSWVNITTANAQDVSATVVQAVDLVFDLAATIGGQIFPSLPAAPDLLSGNNKFELFATVAATGEPVTDTCAVSGKVTVTGDPANDPATMAAQDVFDLVFDACDDRDGYTIDGSFSLIVVELEGDPRTDVFRISYTLRDVDLTIASGVGSYSASTVGNYSLVWDSLAFPVIVLAPTPGTLQIDSQKDVYSWYYGSQSLTVNADISLTTTLGEAHESNMKSASLGGGMVYETNVPLQAADDQDPESGEILISEVSGNETIRIVIESSTSVRLDIDSDGDGIVDDYQYTTWAALKG